MFCHLILLSVFLPQFTNAQELRSPELEKLEADCLKKRQLGDTSPCTAVSCSSFLGSCANGERMPNKTICEGVCNKETCCKPPKKCANDDICKGGFVNKTELRTKWEFADEGSSSCPLSGDRSWEYEAIQTGDSCQRAATELHLPYAGHVDDGQEARFPKGCFRCNKEECRTMKGWKDKCPNGCPNGVVFFTDPNTAISSPTKQISLLRHFGTVLLCQSSGRLCLQKGCNTETCCDARTCGIEFTDGCPAGMLLAETDTTCTSCTSQDCCKKRKCADYEGSLCVDGWKPLTPKTPSGAPKCQPGQKPFALGDKDTIKCPAGYTHITTVDECVQATQKLKIIPSDTNGDGHSVSLNDTAAMKKWVGKRVIPETDRLGARKPFGCYEDKSIRVVNGSQHLVTTIWVNKNEGASRKHDNSAPICKQTCELAPITYCDDDGCTRETCCERTTCKTGFSGRCGLGQYVNEAKLCPAGGCTSDICCENQLCRWPLTLRQMPNGKWQKFQNGSWHMTKNEKGWVVNGTWKNNFECKDGWEPKSADTRCKSSGCDTETCCVLPNCGIDFITNPKTLCNDITAPGFDSAKANCCEPGEEYADHYTTCTRSEKGGTQCSRNTCCKPKICAHNYPCTHESWHWVPKPYGTTCKQAGCNRETCCRQATCGKDFMGGCGAWASPVEDPETVCTSGQCDAATCCTPTCTSKLLHKTQCDQEHIEQVVAFDEVPKIFPTLALESEKFPAASFDESQAWKACKHYGRAKCFAVVDDGCDGKNLKMCVPKRENDPMSVVLKPSVVLNPSCVCYSHAKNTCGYNFKEGLCGAGEKVKFNEVCVGQECSQKSHCCEPKTCSLDFHASLRSRGFYACNVSFVLKEHQKCSAGGCDEQTCCEELTCEKWAGECNPWDKKMPLTTPCPDGVCRRSVCCIKNCPHPNTMCNGTVKDFDPPTGRGKVEDAVATCKKLGREECYAVLDVTGDGMDLKRCIANNAYEQRNHLLAPSATSDVCFYVPADDTCGNSYHGTCKNGMKVSFDTPCTPLPPPGAPTLCPTDNTGAPKPKYAKSLKDTTTCEPDYEPITTVQECVAAAQLVGDDPSDTNGDGEKVLLTNTSGMEAWLRTRMIGISNPLGNLQPHGCYEDQSIRIVNGKQELITTYWINANVVGHKHDNSAPMCKLICDLPPPLPENPCTETRCCESVTVQMCTREKVNCPTGTKFKSVVTMCPEGGCTSNSCCEPLTCAADFHDFCDAWDMPLPGETQCNDDVIECSKKTCCRRGTPTTTASGPCTSASDPCTTVAPPTSPPLCPKGKKKYVSMPKDTTACEPDYEPITIVEDCARAAQEAGHAPSDTNGDGKFVTLSLQDTVRLEAWMKTRVISSTDHLGAHKPYGCYEDQSIRIVGGKQRVVTTYWINLNKVASRKHDNSAPMCKLICRSNALAQKLYTAEDGSKHLRKHAASESMDRPFAITCVAFVMLVTTFALVSAKRQGYFARSSYTVLMENAATSSREQHRFQEELIANE